MSRLRIETERFPKTGKVYAKLYYPDNEDTLVAVTEPVHVSRKAAEEEAIESFEEWMSDTQENAIIK